MTFFLGFICGFLFLLLLGLGLCALLKDGLDDEARRDRRVREKYWGVNGNGGDR